MMFDRLNSIVKFIFKPDLTIRIFLVVFVSMVFVVVLVALKKIEVQTKTNSQYALSTVLITTQEALYLWLDQRQREVQDLASSKKSLQLTESLLSLEQTSKKLISSPVLKEMREFFAPKLKRYGDKGFFIITPEMISLASMRDSNIGTVNLIYKYRKKHLVDVFNGRTKFISTIQSDVALYDDDGILREKLPTQFIASPIYNKKKKIIAVLAIRLDPKRNFSRIVKLGRIGQTGETYAFDKKAVLISESRFDNQLKIIGMVKPDGKGITAISITDPGGDLTKGYLPVDKNSESPLTFMAAKATAGYAGYNTDGYRDYRGVSVFGVWLWDEQLGIGLTTEIDESEAMEPYYSSRLILISVLGFTLLLMFLLINIYRIKEKEKQTIFTATVSMTQHILNNLLNQMQLFQLEAERTKGFDDEVKSLIGESIKEGEVLVERLSSVKELSEDAIRNSVYPK